MNYKRKNATKKIKNNHKMPNIVLETLQIKTIETIIKAMKSN